MKWILAMLLVAGLAGCAEDPTDPGVDIISEQPAQELASRTQYVNQTGSLISVNPAGITVAPETALIQFTVPFGTARVDASVASANQVVTFSITLPSEMGAIAYTTVGQTALASVDNPVPGNYTARVSSDLAIASEYSVSIAIAPDATISTLLAETVVIGPGQFFEVNLQMLAGDTLSWDWTASSDSSYNVHTHFDGEVQYVVEVTDTAHAGGVEVNRTGGISFMWENPGSTPQTVEYRAWGTFQVDSYFPPR